MHNNPLSCDLERLKVSDTQGQHISEWTCCVIVNTSQKKINSPETMYITTHTNTA